jgi:hypothetical protein
VRKILYHRNVRKSGAFHQLANCLALIVTDLKQKLPLRF